MYIDLQPGYQHLDGKKAEQLVRFREGYAQKDLKRIQVQQDFMKALLEKVGSTSTILENLPDIAKVLWESTGYRFHCHFIDINVFDIFCIF